MTAVVRAVLVEPFRRRARLEPQWCAIGLVTRAVGVAVVVAALYPGTPVSVSRGALALLVVTLVATGACSARP